MTDRRALDVKPAVALFDLDGTLTWRDTLSRFLLGFLLRNPARVVCLWRLIPAFVGFLAVGRDRGRLKSRAINAVMGGATRQAIDAWAERFVGSLMSRGFFRPAALAALEAHRAAGDHLILLSASPDLYVPRVGRLLGFERTLCTEVLWQHDTLRGDLVTPNRRGEEKSRCLAWLRSQYPGLEIVAYGNSDSDLPHLRLADHGILVNGNPAARRAATAAGLLATDWR